MKRPLIFWNQELKTALEKSLLNLKTQKAIADKAGLSEPTIMRLLVKPIGEMIEVKTHKALLNLSEFKNTTSGMVTPVNQEHYETLPTDCEHICEKLNPWETNLLKKYANIADDDREKIYEELKKLVTDTEKKSTGGELDMDHDKHQAG